MIEWQDVWGETAYRVWLPGKDAVVRIRAQDLDPLSAVQPTVEQFLHTAAATKLLDALEDNLLLAPIQSSVVPLPRQLYALNRAMSRDRIRYLLADDVAGLPANFMPLFAGDGEAFVHKGEQIVAHGGASIEELIVPFVKVSFVR